MTRLAKWFAALLAAIAGRPPAGELERLAARLTEDAR
jgi:hypothetical protein